jgi:alkylation response protein AidB-like acyl-CoA dehydrogenase
MIGFAPTAEQEAIRDLAHEVAVEQFRPLARTAEELGGIPVTLLPVLNQTGLADLFSPAGVSSAHERPGMLDAVTLALVTEELGFGDGGLALALVGRWLGSLALLIAGTPEQQHQPLVEVSSAHSAGRAVTHVPIAVALAEEAAGFDPSSLDTTARLSGPQYVLSGTKYAVLSGIGAQQYIVLANIAPELGAAGLCLFLVPSDVTGLTVTHDEQPLGLRAFEPAATNRRPCANGCPAWPGQRWCCRYAAAAEPLCHPDQWHCGGDQPRGTRV